MLQNQNRHNVSIRDLDKILSRLVQQNIKTPVMLWGSPGIGKSSLVKNIAATAGLDFIDLRLSQIVPSDLRGLPYLNEREVASYATFDFLPPADNSTGGILFLDELVQAAPAVQAIAQQLILDRCVGNYRLPDAWFVWAAGNSVEDKTATYKMPTALANRFLHYHAYCKLEEWIEDYARPKGINSQIIGFLNFAPAQLHNISLNSDAWPSPRSWQMASILHAAGLSIAPAVGNSAYIEFLAFTKIYAKLPNIESIGAGENPDLKIDEESAYFAISSSLIEYCLYQFNVDQIVNALIWSKDRLGQEYAMRIISSCKRIAEKNRGTSNFLKVLPKFHTVPQLKEYLSEIAKLLS